MYNAFDKATARKPSFNKIGKEKNCNITVKKYKGTNPLQWTSKVYNPSKFCPLEKLASWFFKYFSIRYLYIL